MWCGECGVCVYSFVVLTLCCVGCTERCWCWWSERWKPNKPQTLNPTLSLKQTSEPEARVPTTSNQGQPHLPEWKLPAANRSGDAGLREDLRGPSVVCVSQRNNDVGEEEKKWEKESASGCGLVCHHGSGFSGCKLRLDQSVVKMCVC